MELFCYCGMSVMSGMPPLMPGDSARERPQTKQQNRGSSHVFASSSPSWATEASFISPVMQQPRSGLPLRKGRPLYLVTKHTKFNYSGKGEPCFQRWKVIHMRWTPLLFSFPLCFHYDGSFLSFGGGRWRTCHCFTQCHFACFFLCGQCVCLSLSV